jgi:hypothetical protein
MAKTRITFERETGPGTRTPGSWLGWLTFVLTLLGIGIMVYFQLGTP